MIGLAIVSGLTGLAYLISKYSKRDKFVKSVDKLEKKLFFNVILRYLITAYLVLYTSAVKVLQSRDQRSAFNELFHLF
jgi:hypothetical protein